MRLAASRTFWTAGSSRPMRMAMIAMTTSNSMSVKAGRGVRGTGQLRLGVLLPKQCRCRVKMRHFPAYSTVRRPAAGYRVIGPGQVLAAADRDIIRQELVGTPLPGEL